MGKQWEEEGFDRPEFLLWVSRNQVLVLRTLVDDDDGAVDVDTVPGVGEEYYYSGFGDRNGRDYRCNWGYYFERGEGGWSWTQKPLDWIKRAQNRYLVLPLRTWSSLSPELSSRTPNPCSLLFLVSSMWMLVYCLVD
ncbi:hypothetical protein SLA2020_520310 [Shorea laevis]